MIKCSCKHEYQDQKYGAGNRVATEGHENGKKVLRCTVCGRSQLKPNEEKSK